MKIFKIWFKKCKQCRYGQDSYCALFHKQCSEVVINCSYDQRKICKDCIHFKNPECSIATKGKHRSSDTLRVCNSWKSK